MARKRKTRRKSGPGRLVEALGAAMLFLVVVVFAASIVDRFGGSERRGVRLEWPPAERVRATSLDEMPIEIASEDAPIAAPLIDGRVSDRAIVEVLNGTGQAGLARDMMAWLRKSGFDVVEWGNADRKDYETTQVIDRTGRGDTAERLITALHAAYQVGELRRDVVPEPNVDICVILGRDLARARAEAQ